MAEFSFESYRKTKEYKASLKRFQNKLYFNKKFRDDFFKGLEEGRDKFAELVQKSPQPITFKESQDNLISEEFLDRFIHWSESRKVVEKFLKDDAVTDGKFILYRRNREALFITRYRKGGKRKLRKAYFFLKGGIPVNARRKGEFKRDADYPLDGFTEVDKGTTVQIRKSFEKTILKFVGKKKYKIAIYMRGKNPEKLWAERVLR